MGQLDSGLRSRPLRSQQRSNDAYGVYLTSWEERDTPEMRAVKKKELEKYPLARRCWKGYDHDLLDKLSEEGLINAAGRTYPALITPEGEAEARKLLAQYGIDTEERRRCSAER